MTAPPDSSPGAGRPADQRRGLWRHERRLPGLRLPVLRRRVGTTVRMVAALALVGGVYAALAPGAQARDDKQQLSAVAAEGKQLFDTSCISCHGRNGQGVQGRGPSLIGVGAAAVEFQVNTGRMPMARQEAQATRKQATFTQDQATQLGAFVQELGGGPQLPAGESLASTDETAIAAGGELFRFNCAACHGNSLNGGALSSGKFAPSLAQSTDRDIYAAMLTGPQNVPVFGDNQLTPEEKRAVVAYVQYMKSDQDPGGWGMGRFGPVSEGLAIFLVGMVGLILTTLWIAGKS